MCIREEYILIKKLNELTNECLQLDDDLSSAGEYSRLSYEIEEVAMKMCLLGTNITEDELIEFLDTRRNK